MAEHSKQPAPEDFEERPAAKPSNKNKTHCKWGHPLSGDNLRVTAKARICRTCNRNRVRAFYQRVGDWNPHRKPKVKE